MAAVIRRQTASTSHKKMNRAVRRVAHNIACPKAFSLVRYRRVW
jgi:hypothetical protein